MNNAFTTVDEYISSFSPTIQNLLKSIRKVILETAPLATESISYGMPAYKSYKKPLVYFAAYTNHIGFYATQAGHEKFKVQLSIYKQGKGSVQFPIDKPLPLELIKEIVAFRLENK
jgi:uncharacterized protein YdhG (YjbR/CyaY superfamily)